MTNKVLIVAGIHRSGTSLVTQWLHKCGLNMGENFLGPKVGNQDGHFEDLDFFNFHEKILRGLHLPQSGLTEKPALEMPFFGRDILKGIIKNKNSVSNEWGWKDPRTCLFLPVYRELIPDARYLIVIRDYQSTVNSLINRMFRNGDAKVRGLIDRFLWKNIRRKLKRKKLYKKYAEKYVKVWITYNRAILNHIREIPQGSFMVLDFKLLKTNDKQIFSRLKNEWNFTLNYVDFNDIYKENLVSKAEYIESFVKNKNLLKSAKDLEKEIRHYTYT